MWFDGGEINLYKTQTRYYAADLGRFTQEDPIRAGDNWYAAFDGDPINRVDPSGLAAYFFDGTGNHPDPVNIDGSENDVTNVYRLFNAYKGDKEYTWGIGTGYGPTGVPDGGGKYQKGTGSSMEGRAEHMMIQLEKRLKSGDKVVDLFGFSRGAATATLFLNMIQEKIDSGNPDYAGIDVRYVALFDQVPSRMGAVRQAAGRAVDTLGYLGSFTFSSPDVYARNAGNSSFTLPNGMKFKIPPLHLVSIDEQRKEFAVSDLKGARQVGLKGVHSDVGGGYGGRFFEYIALRYVYEDQKKMGLDLFDETKLFLFFLINPLSHLQPSVYLYEKLSWFLVWRLFRKLLPYLPQINLIFS
jgi:hypothetical protein